MREEGKSGSVKFHERSAYVLCIGIHMAEIDLPDLGGLSTLFQPEVPELPVFIEGGCEEAVRSVFNLCHNIIVHFFRPD